MFSFFKKQPEAPRPEFILDPRSDGQYDLKQLEWEDQPGECGGSFQYYNKIGVAKDENEGRQMIANLERPTIALG